MITDSLHAHTHAHEHTHTTHTHTHACMHACTCTHVHLDVHTQTQTDRYIDTHICIILLYNIATHLFVSKYMEQEYEGTLF